MFVIVFVIVIVFMFMFVFVDLCRGYLLRFHKAGLKPGDIVYIIDGDWFKQWRKVTGYEVIVCAMLNR